MIWDPPSPSPSSSPRPERPPPSPSAERLSERVASRVEAYYDRASGSERNFVKRVLLAFVSDSASLSYLGSGSARQSSRRVNLATSSGENPNQPSPPLAILKSPSPSPRP